LRLGIKKNGGHHTGNETAALMNGRRIPTREPVIRGADLDGAPRCREVCAPFADGGDFTCRATPDVSSARCSARSPSADRAAATVPNFCAHHGPRLPFSSGMTLFAVHT